MKLYDFPRLQAQTLPQKVEEVLHMIASNSSPATGIYAYSILGSCESALQATDRPTQLALFPGNGATQSPKPTQTRPTNPPRSSPGPRPKAVEIEPIDSEFEGDRYRLRYGTFKLRLELPKAQAYELFNRTVRLNWTLDDRGVPTDIGRIWAAAQQTIGGGAR
jgi:hypothetical protein